MCSMVLYCTVLLTEQYAYCMCVCFVCALCVLCVCFHECVLF